MARIIYLLPIVTLFCVATSAQAVSTYFDQANFLGALGGSETTIDFESETAGTTYPSGSIIDGATFTFPMSDTLLIDDFVATTSPDNYLGLSGDFAFYGGDTFSVDFNLGQPLRAVGLYVIGEIFDSGEVDSAGGAVLEPVNIAADFTLTTDSGASVSNAAVPDLMLFDGAAFFIGLIADNPGEYFDTFTLTSVMENFVFNVDDISVASSVSPIPVPAAVWLFGSALLGLIGFGRRHCLKP